MFLRAAGAIAGGRYNRNHPAPNFVCWRDHGRDKVWVPSKGSFRVKQPGIHTLNLWAREDGTTIDKLLITSLPPNRYQPSNEKNAANDPLGPGPAESLRE